MGEDGKDEDALDVELDDLDVGPTPADKGTETRPAVPPVPARSARLGVGSPV